MELLLFFAGVLTTILIVAIIVRYGSKRRRNTNQSIVTQSTIFSAIKSLSPELFENWDEINTQALTYENTKALKYIQMPDNEVYWLDRNRIYHASLKSDGQFDRLDGKITNMTNLSQQEVSKVLFIYNSLRNESSA